MTSLIFQKCYLIASHFHCLFIRPFNSIEEGLRNQNVCSRCHCRPFIDRRNSYRLGSTVHASLQLVTHFNPVRKLYYMLSRSIIRVTINNIIQLHLLHKDAFKLHVMIRFLKYPTKCIISNILREKDTDMLSRHNVSYLTVFNVKKY